VSDAEEDEDEDAKEQAASYRRFFLGPGYYVCIDPGPVLGLRSSDAGELSSDDEEGAMRSRAKFAAKDAAARDRTRLAELDACIADLKGSVGSSSMAGMGGYGGSGRGKAGSGRAGSSSSSAAARNAVSSVFSSEQEEEYFCVCRNNPQEDSVMIGCDNPKGCPHFGGWFHLCCLGLDAAPEGSWICLYCRNDSRK
jgi:hypothetical protein